MPLPRRSRRKGLATLVAVLALAATLYSLAWGEHRAHTDDFSKAKSDCRLSSIRFVEELDTARGVAAKHSFESQAVVLEGYQASINMGINEVQEECFNELLLVRAVDDLEDRWVPLRFALANVEMTRSMPGSEPGHSLEERLLEEMSNFLADELSPHVYSAEPPSFRDSVKRLIGK